jgi:hypothetical protein
MLWRLSRVPSKLKRRLNILTKRERLEIRPDDRQG